MKRLKGLEPSTFCMASRRSSQLSYSRTKADYRGGRPVRARRASLESRQFRYPAAIITTPEMASAMPAPCHVCMRSPSTTTPSAIVTRG